MIGGGGRVPLGVGGRTARPVLFIRPQHEANRAARLDAELLHQPERLPGDHASNAIVRCARANVPRVEVSTEYDNLVRPLPTADLRDDVGRLDIALAATFERQMNAHLATARRDTCNAVRIFTGYGGGRDRGQIGLVRHAAGVRRSETDRT